MTAAFTGAWLATRLGLEPRVLDLRRRSGEFLGVPTEDGTDYIYPAWQFDQAGRPLPSVARVTHAARAAGLSDQDLYALLLRRDGMTGEGRLFDALSDGREDRVLDAIRAAGRR